jgi:hypothetical protein
MTPFTRQRKKSTQNRKATLNESLLINLAIMRVHRRVTTRVVVFWARLKICNIFTMA